MSSSLASHTLKYFENILFRSSFFMTKNVGLCQATIVIIVVAFLQFIIQVSLLTRGVEYIALSLTIDDTYYYLQTAWNTKILGFVTFDGINNTNGVQLLWFVIIVLISMFVKTKT